MADEYDQALAHLAALRAHPNPDVGNHAQVVAGSMSALAELCHQQALQLQAWECLMRWQRDFSKGEKYKEIGPNMNPRNDDTPTLIAEWAVEPTKENDDGSHMLTGGGRTYGHAAYMLALILGVFVEP